MLTTSFTLLVEIILRTVKSILRTVIYFHKYSDSSGPSYIENTRKTANMARKKVRNLSYDEKMHIVFKSREGYSMRKISYSFEGFEKHCC